jgi:hypothetical protein
VGGVGGVGVGGDGGVGGGRDGYVAPVLQLHSVSQFQCAVLEHVHVRNV